MKKRLFLMTLLLGSMSVGIAKEKSSTSYLEVACGIREVWRMGDSGFREVIGVINFYCNPVTGATNRTQFVRYE